VLPVDPKTADTWGLIIARGQSRGRPVSAMDAFIAATARQHDLTLVTRSVGDFDALGIRIINPWKAS